MLLPTPCKPATEVTFTMEPPAREQRHRRPTSVKRALEIDAENVVPDFVGQRVEIGGIDEMRRAGVVDEHVEAAELFTAPR